MARMNWAIDVPQKLLQNDAKAEIRKRFNLPNYKGIANHQRKLEY